MAVARRESSQNTFLSVFQAARLLAGHAHADLLPWSESTGRREEFDIRGLESIWKQRHFVRLPLPSRQRITTYG